MSAVSAAETLRPLLYGNVAMEKWGPDDASATGEPWASFAQARAKYHDGHTDEAVALWQRIASDTDNESRSTLQAWYFLRQAGITPSADQAKVVLGVIAEMPVETGHDVLAAYRDGSIRYLNYSGKVVVIEEPTSKELGDLTTAWFAVAETIVAGIGPWEEPELPALPAGNLRVMMLTPSGPHFGQGPADALAADPTVGRFLTAAVTLLQSVMSVAT